MGCKTTKFFTYVNKKYYYFVLPYVFSILKNTDCDVEVRVENIQKFYDLYGKKIANLQCIELWGTRVTISEQLTTKIIPNTVRFLVSPSEIYKYEYFYITDVDLIIQKEKFEKAMKNNIEGMKRNKTCFFNIKRDKREVLSGIHFISDFDDYFGKLSDFMTNFSVEHKSDFTQAINTLGDEGFLYQFIASTFGDPEELTKGNIRILPGEHISPNRNKKYSVIKDMLYKDDIWKKAFSQFDKRFIILMGD